MSKTQPLLLLMLGSLFTLSACSGSSDQDQALGNPVLPKTQLEQDLVGDVPSGDINQYGVITVGDDAGAVSDLVAAFFKLDESVSAEFLSTAFSGEQTLCTVDDDDSVDFEEISVGFIPSFNNVRKMAISAGESIVITSDTGTFATLESSSAGAFLFYTVPDMQMLPNMGVPSLLQVDIPGDEFPSYSAQTIPTTEMLVAVDYGNSNTITAQTNFTWTPSQTPGALVRIFSSTAGGFFVEDGMTVTCLTPDTGSFVFPDFIQEKLGTGFTGAAPIISRVVVEAVSNENSILYLIRESFAN